MIYVVPLAEVSTIDPPPPPNLTNEVAFVPMASVSEDGSMTVADHRDATALSAGFSYFQNGDVLVAKITPCYENNKIALACIDREHGFGSTEFHVIRPVTHRLDARYLVHFLRQDRVRRQGEQRMTGSAGQRRVPKQFLTQLEIPLPPLNEQKRIATILDQSDTLRRKRRQALTRLSGLGNSIFLDLFDDLERNPKGWDTVSISTACEMIIDCVNRTAPLSEAITPYKMIRTTNVKSGRIDLKHVRCVSGETFQKWNRRATPQKGDVLLTREAPVGEAGIIRSSDHVFLGQRLMLYRPKAQVLTSEFLLYSFLSGYFLKLFQAGGSGSTVKHLSLPLCREFPIRLPPMDLQRRFSERLIAVESIITTGEKILTGLDDLFASLLARAFSEDATLIKGPPVISVAAE